MNQRRKQLLALTTLVLLPLAWLWPCVFGGKTFVPFDPAQFPPASLTLTSEQLAEAQSGANFDVTEVWPWLLPEMELLQRQGKPLGQSTWNPHARTGAPLFEAGVHGTLYPPHWLWLAGGEPKGWLVWLTWISLGLAGVFTYGLLREVALSPLAAWFGAVTFELSGTMASNGFFWTRLPALAWLPALLWALLRLAEGESMRKGPLLAVAVTLALPWLAGFPPYAAAGLALASLLAVRLILERAGRDGQRAGQRLILRLAFAMALGLLLAMPQLLPSAWFYAFDAARSANPGFEMLRSTRFDLYGLLLYLMPDAFGHPVTGHDLPYSQSPLCHLLCDRTDAATGKGIEPNYNYTEYSVFAGTLGLLLAGFGLVRGRGHLRWFVVTVLALLLGLALFLPVVRWLYYLPLIKNVFAMRWLAPGTLFVAWLAAIGFDRLALVERASLFRLAAVTLALAAAVFYFTRQPAALHAADPQWLASAIGERYRIDDAAGIAQHLHIGAPPDVDRFALATERFAAAGVEAGWWLLLCGGLFLAYASATGSRPRFLVLAALPLVTVVQLGLHGSAILPGQRLAHGTDTAVHEFLREQAAATREQGGFTIARAGSPPTIPSQLPPGQLMVEGLRDLHFYSHGDARSIEPLRRLLGAGGSAGGRGYLEKILPDDRLDHPLFDLLGVRYVLAMGPPLQNAGPRVGPRIVGRGGGEFFVYERSNALPRAFTVAEIRCLDTAEQVLDAMVESPPQFDRVALVESTAQQSWPITPGPVREVRFVRDDPTVVELDIAAGAPRYLVLTDAWFPGWSATIDGEPADIARCNHSQRLVRLPETACRVRFRFASPRLPYGWLLFALAVLGLLSPLVIRRASSDRAPGDETAE